MGSGSAGGRPVRFHVELYKGRNVVERSYESLKQWRGLATRYDKLGVVLRGGAILRSIVVASQPVRRHALMWQRAGAQPVGRYGPVHDRDGGVTPW